MSTTPSPSPNPKTTTAVTPATGGQVWEEVPVESNHFEKEILEMIVSLLSPRAEDRTTLRDGLDRLSTTEWHVKTWQDLSVFSSADVSADLQASDKVTSEIKSKVIIKKLGYIVEYAHFGTLVPELTMNEIVLEVDCNRNSSTTKKTPSSPIRSGCSVTVFDKNALPTLEKFSGQDEDYFEWRESTIDQLGSAGCFKFLDDESMVVKHPGVSESVFFALRGAVRGGQAQSIAQALVDEKRNTPMALWSALEEYYNTALNRANVVLFNIRRLLNLRLTTDVAPTTFINDFRDCLQRLRKNNARLAEDTDTLRALLLVSIQDDDFDMVRDSIVQKTDSSVDAILNDIRERTTSLKMKDQASKDGDQTTSRYSRLVQTSSDSSSPSYQDNATAKKWTIPRIPDGWKKSFGNTIFKLVLDWRTAAHKGQTQQQLNNDFNTVDKKIQQKSKTSQGIRNSSGATSSASDGGGNDSPSKEPQRKRIRLQKSRRVITERPI